MPAIHQFVAGFANGDAISNEALAMRRIFRRWGFESEIFSEGKRIHPSLRRQAREASEYAAASDPRDVALLHLSIGSAVNELFPSLRCRKAILYHNITPPAYFDLINKNTAHHLARGRAQLKALSGAAEVNMADSRFNAGELAELGYRDPVVLPLVLDLEQLREAPDSGILRRYGDGRTNVLFVGRCAPNKRIEDVLRAFFLFNRAVNGNSRLIHVGSFAGTEPYYYLLKTMVRELGLTDVSFAGCVPQSHLNAYYRCAHVFLCLSEHEGFCGPLIESMYHGVPVVAYAAAAVPETMDGAGVLFREKRFEWIAEMMGQVTGNESLRASILRGQRERLARYTGRNLEAELRRHLQPLLTGT